MSHSTFATRRASAADVDAIVDLCFAARSESAVVAQVCSPSRDVLREQVGGTLEHEGSAILLAIREGAVVGFAIARLVRPGELFGIGWLQTEVVYVHPDARRRGAGHSLMSAVVNLAVEVGADRIVAMPLTAARSEQRFLARLGFTASGARRVVPTATLARLLDVAAASPDQRRSRRRDSLIAVRRRARGAVAAQAGLLPAAAGAESRTRQLSRAVETRLPDSSVTSIS